MMPASIFAEAIRAEEAIHIARERLATRDHVARHYRAIALPALAAATQRIAKHRTKSSTSTGMRALSAALQQ
jgi:hypothetical protein